ncbi:MAG: hypothetical protein ABIH50_05000 [bacterium]
MMDLSKILNYTDISLSKTKLPASAPSEVIEPLKIMFEKATSKLKERPEIMPGVFSLPNISSLDEFTMFFPGSNIK